MSINTPTITEYSNGHAVKAVDPADKQIEQAIARSVVSDLPPYWGQRWWGVGGYENALPWVEDTARDAYLARLRYHPQNILTPIAHYSLTSQFNGVSWEISGKRRVDHFQDMLMNADRGRGWSHLWERLWWDFFTLDSGAVMEVIGGGNVESYLPRELVVGVGYLNPLRCYFTDNYEYPVWYQDYYGKLHKMHHSRVIRLVSNPLPFEQSWGRGFCALSRSIAAIQQSMNAMIYNGEMLANEPPVGILNVGKVIKTDDFDTAYKQYEAARRRAGNSTYKPVMRFIQQMDKADMEFVRFAQAPEGYDFEKYLRLEAQLVASAWGIDPQDILPLVSGSFGTGKEGEVLDKKSKGKTIGLMFKLVERELNRSVLPDHLEFKFKHYDSEQSAQEVAVAKAQLEIASMMQTIGVPREAVMMYVANTVEAFQDVLLAEDGTLRKYDNDPTENAQVVPLPEGEQPAQVQPGQGGQTAGDVQADVDQGDPKTQRADDMQKAAKAWAIGWKDYEDIRSRYTSALYDTWTGLNDSDLSRRRAGTVARALTAKEGRAAYIEGLAKGGVIVTTLEGDDLDRYNTLVIEASGYISNTTENIIKQGMSEPQIRASAEAYANSTLQKFYYWGIESGDKNGLYLFTGTDGKKPCKECRTLKGQVHRFKDWTRKKLRPGIDKQSFECQGFECNHRLDKTKGRERGNWV